MAHEAQTILISAGTIGTIVMGAMNWLFKRQVKINDEHADRLVELELEAVTKQDLESMHATLSNDITQIEVRSAARLMQIDKTITRGFAEQKSTLDAAHRRVDDIYVNLNKPK